MSLYSISPSTTLFPPPPSVRFRPTIARRHVSLPQITVTSSISAATPSPRRACELFDLHGRLVPYKDAWDWQRRIVKEKKALVESKRDCPDTLIVLQHRPVYTMGTGSSEDFLNFNPKDAPFDVYRTERGGEVTYHGPGQLVMYPIVNLRNHKMDLHWYLRSLEEVVIRALSSAFSLEASRLKGLTGVWIDDWKLAAIGIRVSQWIAYHGLALNVTADLTPFRWIVPCGIRNREVGSIKCLLKEGWTCGEFGSTPLYHAEYTDSMLIDYTYKFLIKEFMEVFQLEIYQNQFGQAFEGVNC